MRDLGDLIASFFTVNSCFPYKILWLFIGVRKLACALRAMERFHPHQSGSKLPHSKERRGGVILLLVAARLLRINSWNSWRFLLATNSTKNDHCDLDVVGLKYNFSEPASRA